MVSSYNLDYGLLRAEVYDIGEAKDDEIKEFAKKCRLKMCWITSAFLSLHADYSVVLPSDLS